MRTALVACLLVASSGVSAQSQSVHWWWFGADQDASNFLAAADIQPNAAGHLEVWTKVLTAKQINVAGDKALKNKERLNRIAVAKIASATPVSRVKELTDEALTEVALEEEVANHSPEVQPVSQALWEIDCSGRMMRTLSIIQRKNGQTHSTSQAGDWIHIPPESMGFDLLAIVCPAEAPR